MFGFISQAKLGYFVIKVSQRGLEANGQLNLGAKQVLFEENGKSLNDYLY